MKMIIIIWSAICILMAVLILPNSGFTKRDAEYYQGLCKGSGAILKESEYGSYFDGGDRQYCNTAVILSRSSSPENAFEQLSANNISIYPDKVQQVDGKIQITSGTQGAINPFLIVIIFFVWFMPLALIAGVICVLRVLVGKTGSKK